MPRLGHPKIVKGQAIACLVRLYRHEPAFIRELRQLRQAYLQILREIAKEWKTFWAKCPEVLLPHEFHEFLMDYANGNEQRTKLPSGLADYIDRIQQKQNELQPYADELAQLACKWKLRAPWAVPMLVWFDIAEILIESGMPTELNIPIELLDFLHPFPPPLPPLEIRVSSLAFVFYDRRQIMSQISDRLTKYEKQLKGEGLRERPSALEKHARWWFEHYVHNKTYNQLAEEYPEYPPQRANRQESIKRAVSNFSRRLGIRLSQ